MSGSDSPHWRRRSPGRAKPEIFNPDPRTDLRTDPRAPWGSQFTGGAFAGLPATAGIPIAMDGRGRWIDNVFIERLWRRLKYEDVTLKGYADGREAGAGIAQWLAFCSHRRVPQALANRTPMRVWRDGVGGEAFAINPRPASL